MGTDTPDQVAVDFSERHFNALVSGLNRQLNSLCQELEQGLEAQMQQIEASHQRLQQMFEPKPSANKRKS